MMSSPSPVQSLHTPRLISGTPSPRSRSAMVLHPGVAAAVPLRTPAMRARGTLSPPVPLRKRAEHPGDHMWIAPQLQPELVLPTSQHPQHPRLPLPSRQQSQEKELEDKMLGSD